MCRSARYVFYLFFGLLAAGFSGCSNVRDLQPDSETVPLEVVELIKFKYPTAGEMVVKPLVKKKIWIANFTITAALYDVLATRSRILSDFKYSQGGPPSSFETMLHALPIGGGKINSYRKSEGETAFNGQADYAREGQRHLLAWSQSGSSPVRYQLTMHPRAYRQYVTESLTDLPDEIQDLLRTKATGTFRSATITDEGNHVFYQISLTGGTFITNEKQEVLYTDAGTTQELPFDALPEAVRTSLNGFPKYAGLSQFRCETFNSDGSMGYLAVYFNNNQEHFLYLDNSGTVKYHYFAADTLL